MKKLFVEIADSSIKREHGLMGRKSIGKNEGMLFKFPYKNNLSFWMKNTYIPLDIAFIDDNGKIVQIETMNALSTRTTTSQVPCRYALEVNSGWFKENNIGVGGQIKNLNICEKSKRYAQMVMPLPDQALLPENAMPNGDQQANVQQKENPSVNPEIQLNMSIRSKLDYATNYNLPVMIVYRTLNGNTLPPRKLLPIPREGYPIVSGKNGYQFKAWDASPTISGLGIEIEGGHPKSFMLDGVISLEILDEGKNQKTQEVKQQVKNNENKFQSQQV